MVEATENPQDKPTKVDDPVKAEELKNEGNEALKAGKVEEAIDLYT